MEVLQASEFKAWYRTCSVRDKAQIDARVSRIETFHHFGDCKNLGGGISELRWKNGRRIYFAKVGSKVILLLMGGHKNAQKKDIQKAKLLFRKYADC